MSTNDVPGARAANNDELAMGCWAEHEDGSLIFVASNEASTVVYHIFDVSRDPVIDYRDAMDETGFKEKFSFDPAGPNTEKWVWHDKTPFPWDRVMANFPDGSSVSSAAGLLSAAARVAQHLGLQGRDLDPDDHAHKKDLPRDTKSLLKKVQDAIGDLGI